MLFLYDLTWKRRCVFLNSRIVACLSPHCGAELARSLASCPLSDRARSRRAHPRRTLIRGCTACEIITTPLGRAAGCRLPCHPRDTVVSLFWPTLASRSMSCHATRLETRDLSGCAGRHGRPAARRRIEQGAHCATDRWRIGHGTHPTCDPPWMQRATMRTSMETGSTSSR